jgi:hypothetical protein
MTQILKQKGFLILLALSLDLNQNVQIRLTKPTQKKEGEEGGAGSSDRRSLCISEGLSPGCSTELESTCLMLALFPLMQSLHAR